MKMNYFLTISKRKFVVLSLVIPLLYNSLSVFVKIGPIHRKNLFQDLPLFIIFFNKVILGPLIETFIFQFLLLEVWMNVFKNHKYKYLISILGSGLAFGLAHYTNTHNPIYTIWTTISGWLLASIYLFSKIRKDVSPFLMVFFPHALINLISFLLNDLISR